MPLNILIPGNALSAVPDGFRLSFNQFGEAILVPDRGISDTDPNTMMPGIGGTSDAKPAYLPNMLSAPAPQPPGLYRTPPDANPDPRYIDPRYFFWNNNPTTKDGFNWRT